MKSWIRTLSVALVLILPLPAFGFGFLSRLTSTRASYYATPVTGTQTYYLVPAYVEFYCPPRITAQPTYGAPRSAPPSGVPYIPKVGTTDEPPIINQSRTGAEVTKVKFVNLANKTEMCRVGFWNLSNRDLVLKINGQARKLPRNKAITLELGRQFVWQVAGSESQLERIPEGKTTLELVLRK